MDSSFVLLPIVCGVIAFGTFSFKWNPVICTHPVACIFKVSRQPLCRWHFKLKLFHHYECGPVKRSRIKRGGKKGLSWTHFGQLESLVRLFVGSMTHTEDLCSLTLTNFELFQVFSFELGQVGDLLALLEIIVDLSVKEDFRASAISHQAVHFLVWFLALGSGGWVVQNICSCSPGRYVCSDSFWVQLCFSENESWMEDLKDLRGSHHCNPCKEEIKLTQRKFFE